jgi:hypothetical protein
VQRMNYVGVPETIILSLKLKLLPKCKRATIRTQLWNWDHLPTTHLNIMHIFCPHVHVLTGNCPSPKIILLQIYSLGNAIFARSNLSWIMHRNSSFDHIDYVFHVWYKLSHHSWCKMCFLGFTSYSIASLRCFPNLDIKSLRDSQTMHFVKTNLHFHTSTLKWCLFFNLFVVDWEIPPMFNSLLTCNNTNKILCIWTMSHAIVMKHKLFSILCN